MSDIANDTRTLLSFMDLDHDVRLIIYRYLLVRPTRVMLLSNRAMNDMRPRIYAAGGPLPPILQRILRTCKQIFSEAMPLLYRDNDFHFFLAGGHMPRLSDFLLFTGPRQAEWMRRIVLAQDISYPLRLHDSDMTVSVRAGLDHFAWSTNITRLRFCFLYASTDLLLQWESQILQIFFGGSDGHFRDKIQGVTIEPRVDD
jgi:hypothetical protein